MIKAVIFDIDNTLYDYDKAHAAGWEALLAYVREHLAIDREIFARLHREAAERVKERLGADCPAVHDRCLRYHTLLEENHLPTHHAIAMSELYWDTMIGSAVPIPGIMECLSKLKEAGYILGIGSDMTIEYQLKKLIRLQMLPCFDFLVCSETVNAEKPAKKLFLACAQKAGVPPEDCLFIGDNLRKDVLGAQNAGMEALWFAPSENQAAMYPEIPYIRHYSQLLQRLNIG